jgi:arginine utilization regulatory protein
MPNIRQKGAQILIEKKYFESLIKSMDFINDGIHIIDASGKILYYNKAARELDGIDVEKAIGRHILDVYPSLTFDTSTLLRVMKSGQPIYDTEQNFINYKGDKISTLNSSIPLIYNNKIVGALEISRNITEVRELSEKIVNLQRELYEKKDSSVEKSSSLSVKYSFLDIIGQSKEMLKLKALGTKAAKLDSPVMESGRTGTGKELFVQAIHNSSSRKNKPFIAQNCAALPANLLESILFGSVKGSFTGAENRPGLFELANGGTLFLDEINSMPVELQPKLLRVLQDGQIRRVGSSSTIGVDIRIISAVNTDIKTVLEENQLREDLYYRLNVICLNIPDLCERKDDIPILTDYFVEKYNKKMNKFFMGVSNEVMEIFLNYKWPGNVRELEHAIESAMSLYDGDIIREEHLPYQFRDYRGDRFYRRGTPAVQPLSAALENVEREIIFSALKQSQYNISNAAKLIDVPRQTLQYKIKKLRIIG